ncbi:MAG: hypothetical protein ACE5Q3_16395, partial [Alphaproteobacteria bacterium]
AATVCVAMVAAPITVAVDHGGPTPVQSTLLAMPGGNGGGHGNGSGNGGQGKDKSRSASHGWGQGDASGTRGKWKPKQEARERYLEAPGHPVPKTKPKHRWRNKVPGSLNAAHASVSAFRNANENSRVGLLALYMAAMADYQAAVEVINDPEATDEEKAQAELDAQAALEASARHLANASNKDDQIDAKAMHSVNRLLDGKAEGFDHIGDEPGEVGNPIHDAEDDIARLVNPL